MQGSGLILDALGRVRDTLHDTLPGLSMDVLTKEPHPPIGWSAWRINRILDSNFSRLAGREQLWIEGWAGKFGMEPNPRDFGPGLSHTREQVAAFKPNVVLLLEYQDAVFDVAKGYLETVSDADLDRELDEPQYTPLPTVAVRLVSVMHAVTTAAGHIGYLRYLHQVGGWFPREAG